MPSKKPRINRGKHIIISDDVHARLKTMCVEAGVQVTQVADAELNNFVKGLEGMEKDQRIELLKKMASDFLVRNPPVERPKKVAKPTMPEPPVVPQATEGPKVEQTMTQPGADTPATESPRAD
jgi:hypothetical protein